MPATLRINRTVSVDAVNTSDGIHITFDGTPVLKVGSDGYLSRFDGLDGKLNALGLKTTGSGELAFRRGTL